jgi:metal-responsive CopG/Arc/MetJ family transcriptional regulator
MKNVSLKLPDDLNARLERASKQWGATKSDIVRDALEMYLSNGATGRQLSIAELAADLVGSIEGPADLATNPKYMRGYGK